MQLHESILGAWIDNFVIGKVNGRLRGEMHQKIRKRVNLKRFNLLTLPPTTVVVPGAGILKMLLMSTTFLTS